MESFMRKIKSDPLDTMTPEMKKKLTPQKLECMGICGMSYAVIMLTVVSYITVFETVPYAFRETPEDLYIQRLISLFLFVNVMSNFTLTVTKRSYYLGSDRNRPSLNGNCQMLPDSSWHACLDCDVMAPPTTHHCILCGHCIIRRDHHCFFTGCCVGYENQRYFIMFCFYIVFGSVYSASYLWLYICDHYTHPISWDFYHYILPWTLIEWIFGYTSFTLALHVFLWYAAASSFIFTSWIFLSQMFFVAIGCTSREFWQGAGNIRRIFPNFRAVFGPYWMLNFIIPMPFLKTPSWETSKFV